jgi:hypothetical protein
LSNSCFSVRNYLSLFLDTRALAAAFAEEVQPGAAYATGLVQFDRVDVGRKNRESPFHAYAIGDLTYCECGRTTGSLALDYITTETLDTLFTTFNYLIINGDIVTGFELWKVFFTCQLLMYILNRCIHNIQF